MTRGLDNFLILEERLAARIEQHVPDLVGNVRMVNSADDIVQRAAAITAWIVPGQTQMSADRSGRALDCTQHWQVILVSRNVAQRADKRPAHATAGPLIAQLLSALAGWHPGAPFGALRAVTPPAPYFEPGLLFYPLEFQTRFAYTAQLPLETA